MVRPRWASAPEKNILEVLDAPLSAHTVTSKTVVIQHKSKLAKGYFESSKPTVPNITSRRSQYGIQLYTTRNTE